MGFSIICQEVVGSNSAPAGVFLYGAAEQYGPVGKNLRSQAENLQAMKFASYVPAGSDMVIYGYSVRACPENKEALPLKKNIYIVERRYLRTGDQSFFGM